MSGVVVRGVRKAFRAGVPVLDGCDLEVADGSLVAVLGPSGCGKTTLLRVIAGFEHADDGEVTVGDQRVAAPGVHLPPERRRVGVVPQEGALFPHLTVAGNVGYGLSRSERRSGRVDDLLALAGLEGLGKRMPRELSGGQQQRVALARALAPRPRVVLLDEPFGGLDAGLRASLRTEVRSILRATEATAVLVTHDQEEALSVADRVAIMRDGRMVQIGPPAAVYTAPVDLGVAAFVGEANVLAGTVVDGYVHCVLGRLPATGCADGPVRAVVRPEQLVAQPSGPQARVTERLYFGHDAMLHLELPGGARLVMRTGVAGLPEAGDVLSLGVLGPVVCYPG